MKSNSSLEKKTRKRWETPTALPLSLRQDTDSDYYSDSFESYISEEASNTLKEILEKLPNLTPSQTTKLLDYVKNLSESLSKAK